MVHAWGVRERTDQPRGARVSRIVAIFLGFSVAGLGAGAGLHLAGARAAAGNTWAAVGALGAAYALTALVRAVVSGHLGLDLIAVLALLGALAVGEDLAAAVIAVMVGTGAALEDWAAGRAQRDLHELLARVPRDARRRVGEVIETVPIGTLAPGDIVLVAAGEIVPVDGFVSQGQAVLDESSLTGEAVPVERPIGDPVRSGVVNVGAPFDLRAQAPASESTQAQIARLVAEAEASRAPLARLADRYALPFALLALAAAGVAWVAGGAVRAVAVLVVATPCPLILAPPIAFVSGLSRAARRGVIVKGAAALERLGACRTAVLDKTGTVTTGHPVLVEVLTANGHGEDEVVSLAASIEQSSSHPLAHAIVRGAQERNLPLAPARAIAEVPGRGITGEVAGRAVQVGRASYAGMVPTDAIVRGARRSAHLDGTLAVFVAIDGVGAGALLLRDELRPDARRTLLSLRRSGIERIVLLTGDRPEIAEAVGTVVGADAVEAEQSPTDKRDAVARERENGPTIVVGDGINDAPALAVADVGVAMGARGSGIAAESADVVLTVDRVEPVGEAVWLARRTRRIAIESILVGMGLSLGAMLAAALGLLPAVWGALGQEAIDVLAMGNALRALRQRPPVLRLDPRARAAALRFAQEHTQIRDVLAAVRAAADELDTAAVGADLGSVRATFERLRDEVVPHERAEQDELYPLLDMAIGGRHPTAPMSRAHVEIADQVRRLGRLLGAIDEDGADEADLADLRRLLYGLHAVLELHTAQEEESYLSLVEH